jgi:hypothetical protein
VAGAGVVAAAGFLTSSVLAGALANAVPTARAATIAISDFMFISFDEISASKFTCLYI